MDFSVVANLASALGTIAAAAVAAYSARLAWKQVRYQFSPRLVLQGRSYQIAMSARALRGLWWEEPSTESRFINGGDTSYTVAVLNIGNGPAYNIKVSTSFDYETLYADAIERVTRYVPDLTVSHDAFGCQISFDGQVVGGFRLPDQAFGIIESLDGSNGPNRVGEVPIDPNLAFFAMCYGYFQMAAADRDSEALLPQVIPVTLTLEYLDSAGRVHQQVERRRLTVRGGRWKSDFSDGVALVSLDA